VSPPKNETQLKYDEYKQTARVLLGATAEVVEGSVTANGASRGDAFEMITRDTARSLKKIRKFEEIPKEVHRIVLQEIGWSEVRFETAKQRVLNFYFIFLLCSHTILKGRYVYELKCVLSRFAVTPREEAFLSELRVLYQITEAEHQRCIERAGEFCYPRDFLFSNTLNPQQDLIRRNMSYLRGMGKGALRPATTCCRW